MLNTLSLHMYTFLRINKHVLTVESKLEAQLGQRRQITRSDDTDNALVCSFVSKAGKRDVHDICAGDVVGKSSVCSKNLKHNDGLE